MTSPSVRRATVDDALGIAEVHVRSWQAAYAGLLPAGTLAALSVEQRAAGWRARIEDGADAWIAMVDGRSCGFVNVGACRDDDRLEGEGELYAIYADPAHWSTGVGHALHEQGIQHLETSGFRRARLWVLEDNQRAISFYERHGWQRDGSTRELSFDELVLPEVRMVREIFSKSG